MGDYVNILIMGISKSGKTSIKKVVFEQMLPYATYFLEPTTQFETKEISNYCLCDLSVTEVPSTFILSKATEEEKEVISNCTALIYVVDMQGNSKLAMDYFKDKIVPLLSKYNQITLSVLFHKSDNVGINPNEGYIKEKQIKSTQSSFLSELNKATPGTKVDFYFTSLYDYSLFESFSCIFQINMQKNYYFSGLINSFAIKSKFEKTYLFDYVNKIYLATNSTPGEKSLFSSCLEAINNLYELSKNYSNEEDNVINQHCKSIFTLNNFSKNNDSTYLLYVAFLFNNLVLVGVINQKYYEKPKLMEYNVDVFKAGIQEIIQQEK